VSVPDAGIASGLDDLGPRRPGVKPQGRLAGVAVQSL
jgi:hypothetical protein